jgi:hypothetical protein
MITYGVIVGLRGRRRGGQGAKAERAGRGGEVRQALIDVA